MPEREFREGKKVMEGERKEEKDKKMFDVNVRKGIDGRDR